MISPTIRRIIPRRLDGIRHFSARKPKNRTQESISSNSGSSVSNNESKIDDLEQRSKKEINELGIPMISADLHRRLFGCDEEKYSIGDTIDGKILDEIRSRIAKAAGLDKKRLLSSADASQKEDTIFELPELRAKTVEDHFFEIAEEQVSVYRNLAKKLASMEVPVKPAKETWVMRPGWTKYLLDGSAISVDFPEEDALFFDVEVCGVKPTLAVAMSEKYW